MNPNDKIFLELIGGFLLLMAFVIWYFGFHQTRKRSWPVESLGSVPRASIDCTDQLLAEFSIRSRWIGKAPLLIIGGAYLAVLAFVAFESDGGISDLGNPNGAFFKVATVVTFLVGLGAWLGLKKKSSSIAFLQNAYEISKPHKLIFEVNENGIQIPTLLLNDPAFWRASEKNLPHIQIPFLNVASLEVLPAMGSSRACYRITTRGSSLHWGIGRWGKQDVFNFGVGIKRHCFGVREREILTSLRHYLGDRLILRIDLEKESDSKSKAG